MREDDSGLPTGPLKDSFKTFLWLIWLLDSFMSSLLLLRLLKLSFLMFYLNLVDYPMFSLLLSTWNDLGLDLTIVFLFIVCPTFRGLCFLHQPLPWQQLLDQTDGPGSAAKSYASEVCQWINYPQTWKRYITSTLRIYTLASPRPIAISKLKRAWNKWKNIIPK